MAGLDDMYRKCENLLEAPTRERWEYDLVFTHRGISNYLNVITGTTAQKAKNMSLSAMAKKILDKETRTLVEAGILDSELELTYQGEKLLKSILFEANKKTLVAEAEEILKERKKDKK